MRRSRYKKEANDLIRHKDRIFVTQALLRKKAYKKQKKNDIRSIFFAPLLYNFS